MVIYDRKDGSFELFIEGSRYEIFSVKSPSGKDVWYGGDLDSDTFGLIFGSSKKDVMQKLGSYISNQRVVESMHGGKIYINESRGNIRQIP